jgi:hypothetical protein
MELMKESFLNKMRRKELENLSQDKHLILENYSFTIDKKIPFNL